MQIGIILEKTWKILPRIGDSNNPGGYASMTNLKPIESRYKQTNHSTEKAIAITIARKYKITILFRFFFFFKCQMPGQLPERTVLDKQSCQSEALTTVIVFPLN